MEVVLPSVSYEYSQGEIVLASVRRLISLTFWACIPPETGKTGILQSQVDSLGSSSSR